MTIAKVSTYKTATRNGFSFDDFAAGMRDYGNIAIMPVATAAHIEYEIYTCDRISAEGQEIIDEGSLLGNENYVMVVATCDCGHKWGEAISLDDNSAASHLRCDNCQCEYAPGEYEINDDLTWKRITKAS